MIDLADVLPATLPSLLFEVSLASPPGVLEKDSSDESLTPIEAEGSLGDDIKDTGGSKNAGKKERGFVFAALLFLLSPFSFSLFAFRSWPRKAISK